MDKVYWAPQGGMRIPESVARGAGIENKEEVYARVLRPGVIVLETKQAILDLVRECGDPARILDLYAALRRKG